MTGLLVLGVSLSAGVTPFGAALSGAYNPSDFASNIAAARELAAGRDPYQADFAPLHAAVLGIPVSGGRPYFPHPPLATVLIRPLAPLSFTAAACLWFGLSLGLLLVLAVLLAEVASGRNVQRNGGPPELWVGGIFVSLLLWSPVLYNLEKGQWSIALAVLTALAWRSLSRRRDVRAGEIIGIATAMKVFPGLLASYLILRSARATAAFAVVLAMGLFLPLLWLGFPAFFGFIRHSQANLPYWETSIAVTYSLNGLFARLLIGGQWARPIAYVPVVSRMLVAALGVCGVTLAMFAAGRQVADSYKEGARFAAFLILLVILNPLSMGHNGVLLALPVVLLGRVVVTDVRAWLKGFWSIGLALTSIPKETIFALCPLPVDPLRGVTIVALPFWGAVLLFTVAITLGRSSEGRVRP
jgi:hypothetical protein